MHYQDPPTHEPTPAEIRQRCIEIQMTWTRQTERSRRVYPGCKAYEPWQPQQIAFPQECFIAKDEVSY